MAHTMTTLPIRVYDINGQVQLLGNPLGEGGEGAVYALAGNRQIAVKLYRDERIRALPELSAKIRAQAACPELVKDTRLAWPQFPVYDQRGDFIGYAMRRANGTPLSRLAHSELGPRHFPDCDRLFIVQVLLSLCTTIGCLHDRGVVLGDLNLENVLVTPAGDVVLIDTDSVQFRAGSRVFRCRVGKPELTAPEFHGQRFETIDRSVEGDAFALAVLMFQCLMLGRHPYDNIGGGTPVENIRGGNFPYGTGGARPGTGGAIPAGPWYVIWSHLTYRMKAAFIATFREGACQPDQRTGVAEWKEILKDYRRCLAKGYHSRELRPAEAKSADQRGLPNRHLIPAAQFQAQGREHEHDLRGPRAAFELADLASGSAQRPEARLDAPAILDGLKRTVRAAKLLRLQFNASCCQLRAQGRVVIAAVVSRLRLRSRTR